MFFQRLISSLLFYPTYFWNLFCCHVAKTRNWWDRVDENMIVGALPHSSDVAKFRDEGVTGVVNTCEEYAGPVHEYEKENIEQFRMPTIDFTHPKLKDIEKSVEFIDGHARKSGTVYVHCKAGRARSATVAICWLIKSRNMLPEDAQKHLLKCRHQINKRLLQRPVVQEFIKQHAESSDQRASAEEARFEESTENE